MHVFTSKGQDKEEEVDSTHRSLKEKQGDKYDNPKLRLWARMVTGGLHNSLDEPPDVPAFQGGLKKKKKESATDGIAGFMNDITKIV